MKDNNMSEKRFLILYGISLTTLMMVLAIAYELGRITRFLGIS